MRSIRREEAGPQRGTALGPGVPTAPATGASPPPPPPSAVGGPGTSPQDRVRGDLTAHLVNHKSSILPPPEPPPPPPRPPNSTHRQAPHTPLVGHSRGHAHGRDPARLRDHDLRASAGPWGATARTRGAAHRSACARRCTGCARPRAPTRSMRGHRAWGPRHRERPPPPRLACGRMRCVRHPEATTRVELRWLLKNLFKSKSNEKK